MAWNKIGPRIPKNIVSLRNGLLSSGKNSFYKIRQSCHYKEIEKVKFTALSVRHSESPILLPIYFKLFVL